MTTKPIPHGTISGRKHYKCKCELCMQADRDYTNRRRRQIAYGRWDPTTDAEPVREHIRRLQEAGGTLQGISAAADLPPGSVHRILFGNPPSPQPKKVLKRTAEAILGVSQRDIVVTSRSVDSLGTRRRIQALAANGWPLSSIAPYAGLHPQYLDYILSNDAVYPSTAQAVSIAFERLWNADPVEHGVNPGMALRCRRWAERNGWLKPMDWGGDIDDPNYQPRRMQPRKAKAA